MEEVAHVDHYAFSNKQDHLWFQVIGAVTVRVQPDGWLH